MEKLHERDNYLTDRSRMNSFCFKIDLWEAPNLQGILK